MRRAPIVALAGLAAAAACSGGVDSKGQSPIAVTSAAVGALSRVPQRFDASASHDSDGQVTTWDWDFGDGTTASGVLVTHTYVVASSYSATLTVTDDVGLKG